MPEGLTFEPVAFATGLALPAPDEVSVARLGFDPGIEFPIEEGDPLVTLNEARVLRGAPGRLT